MRAFFKPDDPKRIIIRDADENEITLINYYMDIVESGGNVSVATRYDLNDRPAGMLVTVSEGEIPPEEKEYVEVIPDNIVNDGDMVSILLDVQSENVVPYYINPNLWDILKEWLESLGLTNIDIVTVNSEESESSKINVDPRITAINPLGGPVSGVLEIPSELIRYVNRDTNKTNIYSEIFTIVL